VILEDIPRKRRRNTWNEKLMGVKQTELKYQRHTEA